MTTYGPFNGLWTSGNYDLCTTVLRKEWGFDGIVMTDWWAVANWEGEKQDRKNRAAMVQAQNDIFMVCPDTENENAIDNIKAQYTIGKITRGQLQRNAKNVLKFALNSLAMQIKLGKVDIGGGGTIAYILANKGVDVIDCGVPVLSMHAPYEVTSKFDIYSAYETYKAFWNE